MPQVPRPEYPRPQFIREQWLNLNGEWSFSFDDNDKGEVEEWFKDKNFPRQINVPYCYQSDLSGIDDKDKHNIVWYQRDFALPESMAGKEIILNFEAVDYKTKVWVNGQFVGEHKGGHIPFSFNITNALKEEKNKITVRVEDNNERIQPIGKQSWKEDNFLCWYTRTTGIWQTVWLEAVEEFHLDRVKMTPDIDKGQLDVEAYTNNGDNGYLEIEVYLEDELVTKAGIQIKEGKAKLAIDVSSKRRDFRIDYWSPEDPTLYDIKFTLKQEDKVVDEVESYFGMRKISIKDGKILLNNKEYYQKLILDQGYYGDGLLTARSEQDFIDDIKKVKEMGFNGVRKHQKIEDSRFMYWCDKLGLLMWAEMPSAFEFDDRAIDNIVYETKEMIKKHYNHPAVITWALLNESWGINEVHSNEQQQSFADSLYHLTKAMDDTRLILANDGWEHTTSDILTLHEYTEDTELFNKRYQDKSEAVRGSTSITSMKQNFAQGYQYQEEPIMISEFGGIAFAESDSDDEDDWGYGDRVSNEEDFLNRFEEITKTIINTDYMSGFCYTQLTDVQQEINGLLDEDHNYKFDPQKIRKVLEAKYNGGFIFE